MLTIFTSKGQAIAWKPGTAVPAEAVWLELHDPSPAERAAAAAPLRAELPDRDDISGIELSSRVRASDKLLQLNIPAFVPDAQGSGHMTPLGFVLTPELLVSQRFADDQAFERLKARADAGAGPRSSCEAFNELVDAFVDFGADRMEQVAAELADLSSRIFRENTGRERQLRGTLAQLGGVHRSITQIRASMLGLGRVVGFLREVQAPWIPQAQRDHLVTVMADLQSLSEFDQQISDRAQFLLDAVLGFISIDQNDVMKVLTVVSVVTIPPVILAGIWGMNFKSIPEFNWPHGYVFALTLIGLSMLVPLLLFRRKGWV